MKYINSIKERPIRFVLVVMVQILVLYLTSISSINSRRLAYSIIIIRVEFEYIDRIEINYGSESLEIDTDNENFEIVKELLYPFRGGTGIHSSRRRELRRVSNEKFGEIVYFVGNEELFSASIYTFSSYPFVESPTESGALGRNVFMIENYYGIIFINDGRYMGRFSFNDFDSAIISFFCVE